MAGVIYKNATIGGSVVPGIRAAKLYDPSLYWYRTSSGERTGIGIIALGKGNGGYDVLLPSCDWERDICVYGSGGQYFRDSACPKVAFTANGVPSVTGSMALFNHNNMGQYIAPPLGWYCATTARYTGKIEARDYDTYDAKLHRAAGVSGIVNSNTAWTGRYEDTPHGSLFYFDITNNRALTFMALVACRNISVDDIYVRHMGSDPRNEPYWSNFGFFGFHSNAGPTYYVEYASGRVMPRRKVIRSLSTSITISGSAYSLYQVYGEFAPTEVVGWEFAEGLWFKITPQSGVASSMYVLEEWVTVHKP